MTEQHHDVPAIVNDEPFAPCMLCGTRLCQLMFVLTNDFDPEHGPDRYEMEGYACHEECAARSGWRPLPPDPATMTIIRRWFKPLAQPWRGG